MKTSLLTRAHDFATAGESAFCSTLAGAPCSEAINYASAILQSAIKVCDLLIDSGQSASGVHAVRTLVEQAKALVDSTMLAVELAETRVGGEQ